VILASKQAVIPFDWNILAFTLAVSVVTGILFGLAPALTGTQVDLNAILQGGASHRERRFAPGALYKPLVISQVALSLSLVIGAGLLIRSLQFLYSVDTGFERNNVMEAWVFPALNGYDHASEMNLYPRLLATLNTIPGVQSASLSRLRMIFGRWNRDVWVAGSVVADKGPRQVYCDPAGPRFFATMGIPLLLGREFSSADTVTSPTVAIISESMAREFFAAKNPIGERFRFDHSDAGPDITIVGVVKDIKHRLQEEESGAAAFIPYTQAPPDMYGQMNLLVRTALAPSTAVPAIRAAIQSVDKEIPLGDITTQEAEIDEYLGGQRSITTLLTAFAALALLLAAIGLYGTMSYAVGRRTKELGIRIALGAQRAELLQMVLQETLRLVLIGVGVGVPLAIAASRLLAGLLFSVKGSDPLTITAAILTMAGIALLAGFVPARRAMRVDPIVALRYE
jgi:predicted permease